MGGWPDSLNKKNNDDKLLIVYNYLDNICDSDISNVDGIKRDSDRVKVILKSISRHNSTLAKYTAIMADISAILVILANRLIILMLMLLNVYLLLKI